MNTRITAAQFEASLTPTNVDGMSENWNHTIDTANRRLVQLMQILEAGREALYYRPFDELRQLAKEIGAGRARGRDELLNQIMSEARQADSIVQRHAKV